MQGSFLAPVLALLLVVSGISAAPCLAQGAQPPSGVYLDDQDANVRPQDDFYAHAVGGWIARVKGPAYLPGWSASRELQLNVYEGLDRDIQSLAAEPHATPNQRKLAEFYTSYMDVDRIDAAGLRPLQRYFREIDGATGPRGIVRAMALLSSQGLDIGFGVWVHADDEAPERYLADFVQSDLSLPERTYYVSTEPHYAGLREAYLGHVERVLTLAGVKDPARQAKAIVAMETRLATAQWTQVATRVPGATTHRSQRAQLASQFPGLDLELYAQGIGIRAEAARFNVSQPSYFTAFGQQLREVPPEVWQAYLKYRLIDHLARFLPAPYRDEADRFYTFTLAGATGTRPRWLRAIGAIEATMGDALGELYVQRHFPPAAKARAQVVLDDVIAAFRERIETSDWLSETGKRGAIAKLDKLVIRLGAPDRIHSYAGLHIDRMDPVGNWMRARALLSSFEVGKLQRPVDREEWTMSAQSVNGYYSVSRNQVVLPAALLQPPYFQAGADDAVNYGALGFFIAHELSHAFDRAGSQYDGAGRRVEWMSAADRAEFERRAHALIEQYGGYEVAPGQHLNGELTIGENIADNAGLAIAHAAYERALRRSPTTKGETLDGLNADQRFFLGFARIWASEPIKSAADIRQALSDTHAPDRLRVIGAAMNQEAFYKAFDARSGDAMFMPPEKRTNIW
ncbi:M13 family metallopeptidase [Paucibacter sp. R3-3]|uniref:M13 family metallopeptidase n=1 Tax=Roseateles agri TaxID=3098619 RepID=A0ABU5DN44_9BURK|nr:M13 family metallopeptidase [Paucibacter sp. R3-3]MDY0747731.1 M13 family metallopeptidase [Paucibacter sp. R3-3]